MRRSRAESQPAVLRHAVLLRSSALVLTFFIALAAPAFALAVGPGLRTLRVSGSAMSPTNAASHWGSASSGARFVAFQSHASNLVGGGGAGPDVFVRDTRSEQVLCVSGTGTSAVPNGSAVWPSISGNGQLVAFASSSTNLVASDVNDSWDVFVRSLSATSAVPVSVSATGALGNGDSSSPALSADGRWIAFVSAASNLVDGDSGAYDDVFVRDLLAGVTTRVSVASGGIEGNGHSSAPSISADGRRVAFVSRASNLVAGDTNSAADVFVVDVPTRSIARASVRGASTQGNLGSYAPSISGNGAFVAFESLATNLVSKDSNEVRDVFVRDLNARVTVRASVSSKGRQGNAESREPSLSHNGSKVAFSSSASTLVSKDTNGRADVFVRSLSSGSTIRISRPPRGQASASCGGVTMAPDGSRAVYHSTASNLVSKDGNRRSDVFLASWGSRVYERVQGDSVYTVAAQASVHAAPFGASAVVLANGADWRAAVAGSGLAGAVRGTLLYTGSASLPGVTRAEIVRLRARKVYIVGDASSVRSSVASDLASIVGTSNVERVGSGDGYAVANAAAARTASLKGASWSRSVLVVSGASARAAIAGLPLAVSGGRPVVFVNPSTRSYRLPSGTRSAIILGGTKSVPASVERSIKRRLGTSRVTRIAGTDVYRTASAIAGKSVKMRHSWDGAVVVNVSKPTEAICGAVAAGRIGTVVLYTTRSRLPYATRIRLQASRYRIENVHVMGTTSSVSSSVLSAIKKALGG